MKKNRHGGARAIALCGVLLSGAAWAAGDAEPRGLDLLERCHQLEDPGEARARDHGYCLGYIVGYVSGFAARDVAGRAGRFCPSADARIGDFADAINQWLVENPDALDMIGAVVALRAFQSRFPCDPSTLEGPGDDQ
jgi:hypothetical protein